MEFHELANLFPLIDGAQFDELVTSIRENGQREAIITLDGKILDGRNRYRACLVANVTPKIEVYDGTDPVAFVVDKNINRRHLNESQRAMIAARLAALKDGQQIGAGIPATVFSQEQAARLLNIQRDSVRHAKKVLDGGTAEEIGAIDRGEMRVSTVAKEIRNRVSAEKREKNRSKPLTDRGKNPERIQNSQIRGEIWSRIRDALTHLTSLPLPAEAAVIARAMDRTGLVDARLEKSLKWIEEFSREWSNRDQAAA